MGDCERNESAMEKLFGNMFSKENDQGETNSIIVTFDHINDELKKYKQERLSLNNDPLQWWNDNCIRYPLVSKFAKGRLTACGTSVPSERVFSAAGSLVIAKRSCFDSQNVDRLLFVNRNLEMF